MISSLDNPKVKLLLKLNMTKYRKSEKLFIVEGEHLVEEARKAKVLVEAFSLEEKAGYTQLDAKILKKICHTDTIISEIGLCRYLAKNEIHEKILILDGIQDPGNLGTIMRSACAFNFKTIFIGEGTVDIYNDKVIRSSQGAIFKLDFIFGNICDFLKEIPEHKIYGTDVLNGIPLEEVSIQKKMAVILGNEGNGISNSVKSLGLPNIYIPMDNTESLNVAIAGSIIMYKLK